METSAKKARRRGRRGWRGGGDDRRARSNEAPGARSIAAPVARRGSRRSSREHAPRTPTAAAHSAAITSRTLARILRRIVPTTRARRCGRAREKTAKRAGVETRRAVRRRRSRSLRAGFPCASRGVDERSRACGPSRTYARGCDRRGGGGCQRNESRARCQRGIFGFLFFEIVQLGIVCVSVLHFVRHRETTARECAKKVKLCRKGGALSFSLSTRARGCRLDGTRGRSEFLGSHRAGRTRSRARFARFARFARPARPPRAPPRSLAPSLARGVSRSRESPPGSSDRRPSRARFGIRPRRPHPRPSIDPRLGLDARLGLDTPLGSTNTIGARR